MDKKLTDSEIKEVLDMVKAKTDQYCQECPYNDIEVCNICIFGKMKIVIDLINRLQARIGVCETCNARKDEAIKHLEAENKRLSAEICGQKEANLFLINDKEKAINGAIKKFCDILKKRINNEPLVFFEQRHIVYDEIDNLVKEMVGADK